MSRFRRTKRGARGRQASLHGWEKAGSFRAQKHIYGTIFVTFSKRCESPSCAARPSHALF
eukprot:1749859-Prymnesium_polylepis.1